MKSAVTIQKVTYIPFCSKWIAKVFQWDDRSYTANTGLVVCYAFHTHTHTHTHMLLSSVTNQGTNLVEVHRTFNSSETAGMFHKKGRTCRRSPKYDSFAIFVDDFSKFFHFFMRPVKEQSERSQLQTDDGPSLNREILSNFCVLPMTLSPKDVLGILCAFYAVRPQVQNKASDKSSTKTTLIAINTLKHKHEFRSYAEQTELYQKRAILLHLLSYKLCYLPFSALVVSSGTAECAVLYVA